MAGSGTLRASAPWRVLDGFGGSRRAVSRHVRPSETAELPGLFARAIEERLAVSFRGSGRSYGDASLNEGGLAIDVRGLNRVLAFDPGAGVAEVEPGVTIEDLWRLGLPRGWWPSVVPGTMFPTVGGCVAMNVHGKNCFRAGPFGDHVTELDLVTGDGALRTLSREREPEIFRATVAGLGLLGAVTRVKLRLHRVEGGRLRVHPLRVRNLSEMFDAFASRLAKADYLVGWIDGFAGGGSLGRGLVHEANYQGAAEDPQGAEWLAVERQGLPPSIMGVPRSIVWRFMRLLASDPGMRLVNAAKYHLPERLGGDGSFLETHVAFAFLLDYVPNWRLAYGDDGFIQYQVFLPDATARAGMAEVLECCRRRGIVTYLGVFKRHRPDEFLLSHGLDGWSLAMDFPVSRRDRAPLDRLTAELTGIVLAAGGRFYAAKDSVLDAEAFARAYGERLEQFRAIKRRLDPGGLFQSDLSRRLAIA
ncbi:MAG TPA: FAD-binding oxidoreductase [Candidatus Acidoferrales bacterium]|nr:FAD-binding oxidoreductase [Candidatus Acidoferrales bacterium]